ncbi:helix-turn-helix domain-containing protein [Corynebacterium variabile]
MRAFGDDFTLVEVKEAAEGLPENLPETVCAFANMPQGGTVLLGVSQRQNFAVTGIAPSQKPAEYRGKAYLR